MFERYTEHARRVMFFARYEASQFGSQSIEPEHFLLGLFREDHGLMKRFTPETTQEMVREQILREISPREKISTSVDMPLSHSLKRVLAHGAEEAARMGHAHIGTEHHLLGLMSEPTLASRILENLGLTLEGVRREIAQPGAAVDAGALTPEEAASEREALRSLIEALPDDRLRQVRNALEHLRRFPGHQPFLRPPPIAGLERMREGWMGGRVVPMPEGHFFSSRMENGTMICETRRFHQGHRITLIERLRVSDDGKTLHYSQELSGPKGNHNWSKDFDIT